MIEHLSWDSDFFGFKVGALTLDEGKHLVKSDLADFQLVYVFTQAEFSSDFGPKVG